MKKLIWLYLALMALGYITAPSVSNSTSETKKPIETGMGTTRSYKFQKEWEDAYDKAPPVIPSGLVLPNGMTVQEFIDSGQTPRGK